MPILGALWLVACAALPPAQEMSDARQAIRSAEEAGAERYAPEALRRARVLLQAAQNNLQAGDYPEARTAALDAHGSALQAREQAQRFATP